MTSTHTSGLQPSVRLSAHPPIRPHKCCINGHVVGWVSRSEELTIPRRPMPKVKSGHKNTNNNECDGKRNLKLPLYGITHDHQHTHTHTHITTHTHTHIQQHMQREATAQSSVHYSNLNLSNFAQIITGYISLCTHLHACTYICMHLYICKTV